MMRAQRQVEEFHRKFGHVIGTTPAISRPELRVKLIREEAKETCDAIEAGDLVEAVDGLCDLLYVTLGAAVEFGIDLEPIFDEVHRSNMAKVGGETRSDGKTLKPPGWIGPDVAGEIERQRLGNRRASLASSVTPLPDNYRNPDPLIVYQIMTALRERLIEQNIKFKDLHPTGASPFIQIDITPTRAIFVGYDRNGAPTCPYNVALEGAPRVALSLKSTLEVIQFHLQPEARL